MACGICEIRLAHRDLQHVRSGAAGTPDESARPSKGSTNPKPDHPSTRLAILLQRIRSGAARQPLQIRQRLVEGGAIEQQHVQVDSGLAGGLRDEHRMFVVARRPAHLRIQGLGPSRSAIGAQYIRVHGGASFGLRHRQRALVATCRPATL